eukprot:TRINITY_DN732_c0_g1_i1.p1 TRINITY_DN732_c0_g1~~TRINITY_DN732_c0_g1_i1.p1  ORF type:complete len:497 (+),score=86.38 TRINITY_DN732_c0_g1_i1:83-1573(+)
MHSLITVRALRTYEKNSSLKLKLPYNFFSTFSDKKVTICGGGIAGLSSAYYLTKKYGFKNVSIIEPLKPCSLTTRVSTEMFRNAGWPDPVIMSFINHSIDLLENLDKESSGYFNMTRRGYAFITKRKNSQFLEEAKRATEIGAGPTRVHETPDSPYDSHSTNLTGTDVVLNSSLINSRFPFLDKNIQEIKHVRRCGWIDAQKLGQYLLSESQKRGASIIKGEVLNVSLDSKRNVDHIVYKQDGEIKKLDTDILVLAPGPKLKRLTTLIDPEFLSKINLTNEIHARVLIDDHLGVIPRNCPVMLFMDSVDLDWNDKQIKFFERDPSKHYLLKPIKPLPHFRIGHGETDIQGIWTYNVDVEDQIDPPNHPTIDPYYPEVVVRGIASFVPGFRKYVNENENPMSSSNPQILAVDCGYYCKTKENRPLVGPMPDTNDTVYILGALSGYGVMSSQAAADLVAHYIAGDNLPWYAYGFSVSRYDDPRYQEFIKNMDSSSGQM